MNKLILASTVIFAFHSLVAHAAHAAHAAHDTADSQYTYDETQKIIDEAFPVAASNSNNSKLTTQKIKSVNSHTKVVSESLQFKDNTADKPKLKSLGEHETSFSIFRSKNQVKGTISGKDTTRLKPVKNRSTKLVSHKRSTQ